MKNVIIIFGCLLLLSCNEKTIEFNKDTKFDVQNDVSYGTDSEQKLDLYIPQKSKQNQDVFIIIHGGGWRGGKKSDLTFFTRSLMEKFPNSVFANIEYRLASTTQFAIPNQTDDIHNVILYLEKELKYKPKFILLGNSAGGHLSMFYAYKFDKNKNIKAVVNIVGPADLSDNSFKSYSDYSFVENHLVDPKLVDKNIQKEKFISPIYWVTSTSTPTLSFYGNHDQIVPISQKLIVDSTLNKNHIFNQSFEFEGDHMGWMKEPNDTFLINKISAFLKDLNHKKAH